MPRVFRAELRFVLGDVPTVTRGGKDDGCLVDETVEPAVRPSRRAACCAAVPRSDDCYPSRSLSLLLTLTKQ
ncbi:MAG: hypothetical protein Q4D79_11670 [Propionibacteriaceae bacterium]|nr:hypothetical protein [Propionibacteriaceae bacterium]